MGDDPTSAVLLLTYLAIAVGLTTWLARTLFRSGSIFLDDVFADHPGLADAVNRLLVVGFFLLNLGYSLVILRGDPPTTAGAGVRYLLDRVGVLLLSLGVIHFVNMALFWKIRRRRELGHLPPPVAPQAVGPFGPPSGPAPDAADEAAWAAAWARP